MKRLNEADLDTRIHRFLDRKFEEFPELANKTNIENHSKKSK